MDKIIKALDAIIKDVTGGAESDAIVADLEELKELISEQAPSDEAAKDKPAGDDPIRKAMGLKSKN